MVTIGGEEIKTATVTKANDAPEGVLFSFKSEVHDFGTDEDGDPITVNIVSSETVINAIRRRIARPKLKPNQQTVFAILHSAGSAGLSLEDWNNQAKDMPASAVKRKADLNRHPRPAPAYSRAWSETMAAIRWHVVHAERSVVRRLRPL